MTNSDDLKRRVTGVEASIGHHVTRLNLLEVAVASERVRSDNIATDLLDIKDTLKWLVRLIISALILAAIGFALGGGFVLG